MNLEHNFQEIADKYIDLVAIKRIGTYNQIAIYKKEQEKDCKKKYCTIKDFLISELKITEKEFNLLISDDKVVKRKEKIDKLFRNQFSSNEDRKKGFQNFSNFYQWYLDQNNECFYCKTSYDTLLKLFQDSKLKSEKFNATLHIEQIDPKKGYNRQNCRLACSLCNNTKSDLISKENYKKYFASNMHDFLKDLSTSVIENDTF